MRWGRRVSSVSRCIGLEDVNSSMEKEKEKTVVRESNWANLLQIRGKKIEDSCQNAALAFGLWRWWLIECNGGTQTDMELFWSGNSPMAATPWQGDSRNKMSLRGAGGS